MWKCGRSCTTASEYSAIEQFNECALVSQGVPIASKLQVPIHLPQPTHFSVSIKAFLFSSKARAECAQYLRQVPQLRHFSASTTGLPSECIALLPALLPQPIPIFLIAPPKPVISWPLKWEREIKISASITARPI